MHAFKFLNKAIAVFSKEFGKNNINACGCRIEENIYIIVYKDITDFVAVCVSDLNEDLWYKTPHELSLDSIKAVSRLKKISYEDKRLVADILEEDSKALHDAKHPAHHFRWDCLSGDMLPWVDTLSKLCRVIDHKSCDSRSVGRPQLNQIFSEKDKVAVTNGHFLVKCDWDLGEVSIHRNAAKLLHYGSKSQKLSPVFINNIKEEQMAQIHCLLDDTPMILSTSAFLYEGPPVSSLEENFNPKGYTEISSEDLIPAIARVGKTFTDEESLGIKLSAIENDRSSVLASLVHRAKSRVLGTQRLGKYADIGREVVSQSYEVNWSANYLLLIMEMDITKTLVTSSSAPSVFIGKDGLEALIMPKRT